MSGWQMKSSKFGYLILIYFFISSHFIALPLVSNPFGWWASLYYFSLICTLICVSLLDAKHYSDTFNYGFTLKKHSHLFCIVYYYIPEMLRLPSPQDNINRRSLLCIYWDSPITQDMDFFRTKILVFWQYPYEVIQFSISKEDWKWCPARSLEELHAQII